MGRFFNGQLFLAYLSLLLHFLLRKSILHISKKLEVALTIFNGSKNVLLKYITVGPCYLQSFLFIYFFSIQFFVADNVPFYSCFCAVNSYYKLCFKTDEKFYHSFS